MRKATNNFSPSLEIRNNGSSRCYKGILDDGSEVVVMVYSDRSIDFTSMIRIMSDLRHKNVVELIGYCIEDDHRILVHEFVGGYNLYELLKSEDVVLDWCSRVSICHGIAYGLEYLHNAISPCVVHGDVNPRKILMDCSLNPKIAYFGDQSDYSCSEVTVCCTLGYMDPELCLTGRYSEKTDVYAFGITLLVIVNGAQNPVFLRGNGRTNLVDWAWELRESGRIAEIIDKRLLSEFSEDQLTRLVNVALSCVQLPSDRRPSMSDVRRMLSDSYDYSHMVVTTPNISAHLGSPLLWSSNDDQLLVSLLNLNSLCSPH
ncbi:hypothetical protein RDABS01_012348 [Bienertia sinuspersici]